MNVGLTEKLIIHPVTRLSQPARSWAHREAVTRVLAIANLVFSSIDCFVNLAFALCKAGYWQLRRVVFILPVWGGLTSSAHLDLAAQYAMGAFFYTIGGLISPQAYLANPFHHGPYLYRLNAASPPIGDLDLLERVEKGRECQETLPVQYLEAIYQLAARAPGIFSDGVSTDVAPRTGHPFPGRFLFQMSSEEEVKEFFLNNPNIDINRADNGSAYTPLNQLLLSKKPNLFLIKELVQRGALFRHFESRKKMLEGIKRRSINQRKFVKPGVPLSRPAIPSDIFYILTHSQAGTPISALVALISSQTHIDPWIEEVRRIATRRENEFQTRMAGALLDELKKWENLLLAEEVLIETTGIHRDVARVILDYSGIPRDAATMATLRHVEQLRQEYANQF